MKPIAQRTLKVLSVCYPEAEAPKAQIRIYAFGVSCSPGLGVLLVLFAISSNNGYES